MFYSLCAFLNLIFLAILWNGLTDDLPEDIEATNETDLFKYALLELYGPIVGIAVTDIAMILYSIFNT